MTPPKITSSAAGHRWLAGVGLDGVRVLSGRELSGENGLQGDLNDLKAPGEAAERELARSNSLSVAQAIGEPIMIPPAGNNLRDLYLLARS